MSQLTSVRIAWRYLRAEKSHSAVGAIAIVSLVGVAIATAAIVCVLSVFNGFREVLATTLDSSMADVVVLPARGKVLHGNTDSLVKRIEALPEVEAASVVVADNALALVNGHELPVLLKGVEQERFRKVTPIDSAMIDGDMRLRRPLSASEQTLYFDPDLEEFVETGEEDRFMGILGAGVAMRLGVYPADGILLFAPRRIGNINSANPAASFLRDSVEVSGVIRTNRPEFDASTIIVDIDVPRRLFQYTTEATSIELKVHGDASKDAAFIQEALGKEYVVKDRLRQQETNFRMIEIEKWVTFLLLSFILLIASFNAISTLSMLVLDKEPQLPVLRALGMSRRQVADVFAWESIMVTVSGYIAGTAVGIGLCLLQRHFGFIKLAGNPDEMLISVYPVAVDAFDLVMVLLPTIVIGAASAIITARFAKSRIYV